MNTIENCIYCGSPNNRLLTKSGPGWLLCRRCDSVVCLDLVNPKDYYTENYHAYRWSWLRPKIYYLGRKAFACGLRKRITVADLGCGGGHSLWWAKAMGCYTIGWDIPGVRTCASVDELYHEELLYFATLNTARCDVVWCWHTIEHSDTPRDLIEAAYQILKPGGIAYFEYPEAGSFVDTSSNIYCDAHFPEHRGLPSILWMNRTAEKIGFRTIKTERPKEGRWMYGYTGSNRHIRSVLQK